MSRFSSLEFHGGAGNRRAAAPSLLKDENHCLAEARRAFEHGAFEPALRGYARALEFNPRCAEAWLGQARMLVELADYAGAVAWADQGLERLPHALELFAVKAMALARSGALDEALACSDLSMEDENGTPFAWLARADVLLARDEARAGFSVEKALELAPGDWFIAWLAGRIRQHHRQFVPAMSLFQQGIRWDAGRDVLWVQLGECQAALGDDGEARRSFGHALDLNPSCEGALAGLAGLRSVGMSTRLAGLWRRFSGR